MISVCIGSMVELPENVRATFKETTRIIFSGKEKVSLRFECLPAAGHKLYLKIGGDGEAIRRCMPDIEAFTTVMTIMPMLSDVGHCTEVVCSIEGCGDMVSRAFMYKNDFEITPETFTLETGRKSYVYAYCHAAAIPN